MRIFKTKAFARFSQEQKISDQELLQAIHNAEQGLISANLGNGIIKQRIAKQGQGKSGGYRTIIFYRIHQIAFFVVGFEKSKQENLSLKEEKALRQSAKLYFALSESELNLAVSHGTLIEING